MNRKNRASYRPHTEYGNCTVQLLKTNQEDPPPSSKEREEGAPTARLPKWDGGT